MKLRTPFVRQEICDMIVAVSPEYNGLVRLSPEADYIFSLLSEETTEERVLDALEAHYEAPRATLEADLKELLDQFRQAGLLEE